MPVDLSVFQRQKTIVDQQQLQAEFELKKQLIQAQVGEANRKAMEIDVDKLGEQAIFKALQGGQLTPQEQAAAKYAGAKGGGVGFDPNTGSMYQKPNLATQLGLNLGGGQPTIQPNIGSTVPPGANSILPPGIPPQGNIPQEMPFDLDPSNEYDMQFKKVYEGLGNNPKAQQQVLTDYSKDRFNMNESQAKAGGFADLMGATEPTLSDPKIMKGASSNYNYIAAQFPWGSHLTSPDYDSGQQAKQQFINALLRRDSGAAISPTEDERYTKQYFPLPGEGPKVIAQKARARANALAGVARSAGPAYRTTSGAQPKSNEDGVVDWDKLP